MESQLLALLRESSLVTLFVKRLSFLYSLKSSFEWYVNSYKEISHFIIGSKATTMLGGESRMG